MTTTILYRVVGRAGISHYFRREQLYFFRPESSVGRHVNMAASHQPASIQPQVTELYLEVPKTKWPILYSAKYNIYLMGLQNLVSLSHGFDVGKWGHVYDFLKDEKMFGEDETVEPREADHADLAFVHEEGYLQALKMSRYVAGILEFLPLALVPNGFVQSRILTPFRYQTGGTILGARLAMERGWAINIGGGFHHSHHSQGGGFCVYADITLAVRFLQNIYESQTQTPGALKTMIVDLDAHQGNGHERDFMKDDSVYILDVYNKDIYPNDKWAKKAINKKVEVESGIGDERYLQLVGRNLYEALAEFTPDLVVYNAGTDIMDGDPLGKMRVSQQGIIDRDEIVFKQCREREPPIPILMVTSGGYQPETARVIADSIQNLLRKGLITPPGAEPICTESRASKKLGETASQSEQPKVHEAGKSHTDRADKYLKSETNDDRQGSDCSMVTQSSLPPGGESGNTSPPPPNGESGNTKSSSPYIGQP